MPNAGIRPLGRRVDRIGIAQLRTSRSRADRRWAGLVSSWPGPDHGGCASASLRKDRSSMSPSPSRRRPLVHITLQRAARLHRLVRFLAESPQAREAILSELAIGLRTFYRELELLNRCGV